MLTESYLKLISKLEAIWRWGTKTILSLHNEKTCKTKTVLPREKSLPMKTLKGVLEYLMDFRMVKQIYK